jgi:septum formation protein
MKAVQLILASKSPRRLALLKQIGWEAEVQTGFFPEATDLVKLADRLHHEPDAELAKFAEKDGSWGPAALTVFNARGKCLAVGVDRIIARADKPELPDWPILGADTVVALGQVILGKPKDGADALRMLMQLSGHWHEVITGFAISNQGKVILGVERTRVHYRKLSLAEITAYVNTGEPLDKAGAYGIQGRGAVFIDRIEGSYSNVVGLPLTRIYQILANKGEV